MVTIINLILFHHGLANSCTLLKIELNFPEIIDLTEDMHACANQIIEHFTGPKSAVVQGSINLKGNPGKLCYVLKQCIRECAVGKF